MRKEFLQAKVSYTKVLAKPKTFTTDSDLHFNLGLISFLFLLLFIFITQLSHAQNCTGFRTQAQQDWRANSSAYLHDNFHSAFPCGLTIGCGSHLLLLTDEQAAKEFLPSGASPDILPEGTLVNTAATYKNELAGELETAILNVGFNACHHGFGSNEISLGDLFIARGPFSGWTVLQLIVTANNTIGGCNSSYSLDDLNEALKSINSNYENGTSDKGYLTCEHRTATNTFESSRINDNKVTSLIGSINVYPNPAASQFTCEFHTSGSGFFNIEVENLLGQIVFLSQPEQYNGSVKRDVSLANIHDGIYILHIYIDGQDFSKRLSIHNTN